MKDRFSTIAHALPAVSGLDFLIAREVVGALHFEYCSYKQSPRYGAGNNTRQSSLCVLVWLPPLPNPPKDNRSCRRDSHEVGNANPKPERPGMIDWTPNQEENEDQGHQDETIALWVVSHRLGQLHHSFPTRNVPPSSRLILLNSYRSQSPKAPAATGTIQGQSGTLSSESASEDVEMLSDFGGAARI